MPEARAARRVLPLALAALALAGCASADKNAATTSSQTSAAGMAGMSNGGAGSMDAMTMAEDAKDSDGGTITATKVAGLTAVPTTVLASTTWQGMRITAEARSPLAFMIPNGTGWKEIKPGHSDFHLMIMLNDTQTAVDIPYASVWATITRGRTVIFSERQWPMISRYMGPHYGNDVTLPSPGTYHLSLLVSPPVSARHMEYANVWLAPHRVDFTFHWRPLS